MKTKSLRSTIFFLSVMAALLLTNVQRAAADRPDREFLEGGPFLIEDSCTFPVQLDELTNKEYLTVFYDKDGNPTWQLVTGTYKVRLTNTSNGKSMDVNISGPGKATLMEEGTERWHLGGNWLIMLFPTDVPDFQPRMFLNSGRLIVDIDPEVGITDITRIGGKMVDVCAALGD